MRRASVGRYGFAVTGFQASGNGPHDLVVRPCVRDSVTETRN